MLKRSLAAYSCYDFPQPFKNFLPPTRYAFINVNETPHDTLLETPAITYKYYVPPASPIFDLSQEKSKGSGVAKLKLCPGRSFLFAIPCGYGIKEITKWSHRETIYTIDSYWDVHIIEKIDKSISPSPFTCTKHILCKSLRIVKWQSIYSLYITFTSVDLQILSGFFAYLHLTINVAQRIR